MPELPEHVKAKADQAVSETGANKTQIQVQDLDTPQAVDTYGDRGKELEAMREQKREDAQQEKNQPDKV